LNEARVELEEVVTREGNSGVLLKVIQGTNDLHVVMPSHQALDIAETIAKMAHVALTGQVGKDKSVLSEMIHNKINRRVELVVQNLVKKKQKPEYIARQIIDIVLQEVL